MLILRSLADLARFHRDRSALGRSVLVPTMGALHEGHAALIRRAAAEAFDRGLPGGAVVTIFVNPTQFNNPADLARYPRTFDADAALCQAAGAAAIFAPDVDTIYPPGATPPAPALPPVATQPNLEDAFRPGHFAGVCQVVKRLFELTRPAAAVFGEKDWQQLQVVRAMVELEDSDIEILPEPTIREPDGLAMSSRNRFLTSEDRPKALAISSALAAASNAPSPHAAEQMMLLMLKHAGITPEYAVVRQADSLLPVAPGSPLAPARALIAAPVGAVRLIDNAPWSAS